MKRTDVTYQDKFNELRLDISHPNSRGINFIFVEGDSDIKLYRKLFDLEKCKVETIPGGKEKVEQCVRDLSIKCSLVIGIRDADFMHLGTAEYSTANMFLTDYHDIEMTMLAQKAILEALAFEYTNHKKPDHQAFLHNMMQSIKMVGYLKWLNDKENLRLRFSGSGFLDLINFNIFELDFSQYLTRVLQKSTDAEITDTSIIMEKIEQLSHENPDLLQLTNGHDLLNTLAKFFKEEAKRKSISDESIASALRVAFTTEHFKETHLYEKLHQWAIQNQTSLF